MYSQISRSTMQRGTHKEVENKMKLKQVIMNFVMLLAIALIGTGAMGCQAVDGHQ